MSGKTKKAEGGDGEPIIIKKYANRRLYNTATSSYVTLDFLADLVKEDKDFVVYDAKSGEDITRSVLTQIIFEEESKGQSMLPIDFLRKLIGFYGDNLQAAVPRYLELSMEAFARDQERVRDLLGAAFRHQGGTNPLEEMARRNAAVFENALKMFTPFGAGREDQKGEPAKSGGDRAEMDELKDQLAAMQKKLDDLASK